MNSTTLIPAAWAEFPDDFRQRMGATVGRQRMMLAEDQMLIVAHLVPKRDEATRRGILFWRDASARWKCSNGEDGLATLEKHLSTYAERIEALESEAQKASKADDYLILLDSLAPIVRSSRNLLDTLEEARKAMPLARELIDIRDRAYDLSRQAELLYEDSKNAMDVAIVRRADEQAKATHEMMVASHRLNILAAMFFPFATLGAIFGTTLTDNWSWAKTHLPFVGFLLASTLIGLMLTRFVTRPA